MSEQASEALLEAESQDLGRRHTKTPLTSGEDRQRMIDIIDLILPRKVFERQKRRLVLGFTTVQSEVST
jgi:hypothetical protein